MKTFSGGGRTSYTYWDDGSWNRWIDITFPIVLTIAQWIIGILAAVVLTYFIGWLLVETVLNATLNHKGAL